LINAICVCLIEDFDGAGTRGPVTNTAGFLASIERFDAVRPDKVKHRVILLDFHRVAKHALRFVLVELEELRVLPFLPVRLFK
jgi:hypothetical protein